MDTKSTEYLMPNMKQHIEVDASADHVWAIVGTHFGDVAAWANPIHHSEMLTAELRLCLTSVGTVRERLLALDPVSRTLTYEAVLGPPWMKRAVNTWTVTPRGEHRCRVESAAVVEVAPWAAAHLLVQLPRLARMARSLDDLKVFAETGEPSARKRAAQAEAAGSTAIRSGGRTAHPALWSLRANVAFSAVTGVALALDLAGVSASLGPSDLLTRTVGLGLLGFAGFVAWATRRVRPGVVLAISAADLLWVAASAVWVLAAPSQLPLVGGTALVVLGIALAQLRGVREGLRETRPDLGDWRHCVAVEVAAPPDLIWARVGDLGAIAAFMPDLAESGIRGELPPAAGAVRVCRDRTGAAWAEAVTSYDADARCFAVRFLHEEEGFPYPARRMYGGWSVTPAGGGSRVEVWWSLTPTAPAFPWVVVALMGLRIDPSIAAVVGRMDVAARGENPATSDSRSPVFAAC